MREGWFPPCAHTENKMSHLDRQNRARKIDVLPDSRLRVTERLDAQYQLYKNAAAFVADVLLPWGTACEDFPECRLVSQPSSGQIENAYDNPNDPPPVLLRVYEEIPEDDRVIVGEPGISFDQYGRKSVVIEYIQFSDGSTAYADVVGTTAAPAPNAACILKTVEGSNDGTLRSYKLTFIDSGEMARDYTLNFGGNLIILTITSLNEIPATPAGYTLFGPGVEYVEGLPLYRYRFSAVNGGGVPGAAAEIDRQYYNAQGGTVQFNPAAPTSSDGTVKAVIQYITDPTVTSNPIPLPSGFVLVGLEQQQNEGYKTWTGTYYFADGLVVDESTISDTGGLVIYHRVSYGSAPAAPSATIGGTVTEFDSSVTQQDGYVRYEKKWAEGDGEVDRRYTNSQGGAVAFNPASPASAVGNVVCTITHFTATSVSSNPTSPPAGSFYLISIDNKVAGGYRIWTAVYGHGDGLIVDETTIQVKDALVTYHRVEFGAAPATPSATIGGTVTLFDSSVTHRDGFDVYDYRWVEGDGQSSITTDGEADGALNYTVVTLTAAAATPAYPGGGTAYLVRLTQQPQNGYFQNTAVYKKPPATQTFNKKINFTKPGSAAIGGSPIQFTLSSQVTMTLLASVEVSYSTSQISDTPFTVSAWATFYESYTPTDTGIAVSSVKSLGGYLAGASGSSGTNSVYNGILCDEWSYQLGSSTPSSFSSGAKVLDVDNDPYLVATDGTVVYRRTKVSYTF